MVRLFIKREEVNMGHYIEVDANTKLYVEDVGTGKPVVFIHGWPVNHKMFEYQFSQLPKHGFRCIGIDLRGFGQSDKPWCDYTYDQFADDVRQVLDALDLKDVTLCGFSMGGAIAIRYMAKYAAHRVKKLVLMGAAAPVFTQRPDYPYGFKAANVDGLIDQCYQDRAKMLENFGNIFFYDTKKLSQKLQDWFHSLGMQALPHATVMSAIQLRDQDLRGDLASITVPTLIMQGKEDKICPFAFAEQLQQGIKHAELVVFEKSGHGLFWDEQAKFNAELIRFA
jgi:non-heme chloroperoxidase